MNFTREPLVETIITPKEGHKLIVRNSKVAGHEEYSVDALEIVSIGQLCFFRSLEKPKQFFVPAQDYEVLEMRESRMVLKTPSVEKGIKIGGGREASVRTPSREMREPVEEEAETMVESSLSAEGRAERGDKKRDKRRNRKRRERTEGETDSAPTVEEAMPTEAEMIKPGRVALIPPPSTLISETLLRHKVTPPTEEPIYPEASEMRLVTDFSLNDEDRIF